MQGNSTFDVMVESWGEAHHHQNMVSFEIHASELSVSLCVWQVRSLFGCSSPCDSECCCCLHVQCICLSMGRLVNKVIHHVVAAKIHQGAVPSTPPQTSHPRNGQPASWVMPSVIVPHPLRPNKRVLVELPDSSDGWTANDTKNAIEMALLAKYGRVAPGVGVPKTQHAKHGQDQAVVKAGESAHNETMDWDVAQCKQNVQQQNIIRPRGDLCSTLRPGTWRRPLRGGHYCSIDLE